MVITVLLLCLIAVPSQAGFVQKESDGTRIMIQDGKLRVVPPEQDEPWFMADLDKDRLTMGDPTRRVYASGTSEEYCRMMKQMMQAMAAFMPHGLTEGGSTPEIKVVREGPGGNIAGYKTTKYKILEDGRLSEEIWLTEDPSILDELGTMKNLEFMECGTDKAALAASPEYARVMGQGWPMRSIDYIDGYRDVDTDVVSIQKRDIPGSEYEPPSGYKQVSFPELFEMEEMGEEESEEEDFDLKGMMEGMGLGGVKIPGFGGE
jgi:hypothetical protein